jgi:hypothetical protein
MASTNKQTLFRFKTVRAPKQLDPEENRYFIQHPDGSSGKFFTAIAGIPTGSPKRPALETAAANYTQNFQKVSDVSGYDLRLWELAQLFLKKKKTVTHAEVSSEIASSIFINGSSSPIADMDILTFWDELFYQVITQKAADVREAILHILLADYIVREFPNIPATDEAVRKLIGSRIVIPKDFVIIEKPYTQNTISSLNPTGNNMVFQHLATAEFQLKTQQAINALEEVREYKAQFNRTHTANEAAAMQTHQKTIADLAHRALTDETINPSTIPAYTYIRPQEVDQSAMSDAISENALDLLNKLDLFRCKNFNDLEKELENHIRTQQNATFKRTAFHNEKLAVDGTLLSKSCSDGRTVFSYVLKPVLQATGKYALLLVLDAGSPCLKLESVKMDLGKPVTKSLTTFEYANKDGILTVNLTPTSPLNWSAASGDVAARLTFSNGSTLELQTASLNFSSHLTGLLTQVAGDSTDARLYVPSGFGITRLGVSDYRKVEQTLCCYVPGEVSHIENVMAREYKERSTRRLRRSEETTTTTQSRESEHQTDTTSTSRYELQQEISQVLSETMDRSTDVNANSSFSYGKESIGQFNVGIDVSSNFASSSSQENSDSLSTSFAKEVTAKALDRVVSKISEERVTKIIEEFEEQNRHGFDNRQGAEHISGVFRWVDKVYKNQIHNYGRRLQYEFMIPEPASFHTMAKSAISNSGSILTVREPNDPRTTAFGLLSPITHAGMITEDNYQQWAAVYKATVAPPPDRSIVVGKSIVSTLDSTEWAKSKAITDEIRLPEGYGIQRIYVNSLGNPDYNNWSRYYVSVAGIPFVYWSAGQPNQRQLHADDMSKPELSRFAESVPIAVQFTGISGGVVSVELELVCKASHFADWQLETYNAIIEAYEDRVAEYKSALAEVEVQRAQLLTDNPAYFRRIENTVLKKNCIAYMIGHLNMGKNFIGGDNPANSHVQLSENMDRYAATVKFFEQAFEWNMMDYTFYPFYWANRQNWNKLYALENDDSLFRSFLQAGMARVDVTVRPGFEEAVLFYMNTGQIWNGGDMPVIGDDLYMSIANELAGADYYVEETWETRVPSTLTVVQAKTIALEAQGLPCYCDNPDQAVETITQPTTNPLTNLEVYIPGNTGTTQP